MPGEEPDPVYETFFLELLFRQAGAIVNAQLYIECIVSEAGPLQLENTC